MSRILSLSLTMRKKKNNGYMGRNIRKWLTIIRGEIYVYVQSKQKRLNEIKEFEESREIISTAGKHRARVSFS